MRFVVDVAKLKINLVIAGRRYPLSVKDTQEEEGMRKAATKILRLGHGVASESNSPNSACTEGF